MEKETLTGHKKHLRLNQPSVGQFCRNEWAFIGAPCDEIYNLVNNIMNKCSTEAQCVYVDESHGNNRDDGLEINGVVKRENIFNLSFNANWNKYEIRSNLNNFDFCFINGNHFKANKQIVILNKKKEESLSRKLDRLTNVVAFITTDDCNGPYDFLQDLNENDKLIPKFHINNIDKIWAFIKSDYQAPSLKALVLAGGKSQRMGIDKGLINYHGKEQRFFLYEMLSRITDQAYISCRDNQLEELEGYNTITDKFLGLGPFGAIASAFMEDPDAAWLVVPCDLPFLSISHLSELVKNRNLLKSGTAFLNNETGFPEPLISIWEPKIYQQMLAYLAQGFSCPRKVLINSDINLVSADDQSFMTNVNTPEEYKQALVKMNVN